MIKQYFDQMSPREQVMVIIAAIMISLSLIYLLIYQPIVTAKDNGLKQLHEKQATLVWMEQVNHLARKSPKQTINNTNQLLSILTNQLSEPELKPFTYQLQQSSGGNVQLSFEKVPFNRFMTWLLSFQQQYAVSIDRLTATKLQQEGMVQLNLVIKP